MGKLIRLVLFVLMGFVFIGSPFGCANESKQFVARNDMLQKKLYAHNMDKIQKVKDIGHSEIGNVGRRLTHAILA